MKIFPILKQVVWVTLFLTLLSSSSVFASNLLITRSFSGVWDMPDHESQGIILQIGEQLDESDEPEKVGIAYWFTYGEDLQTSWYLGVGDVNGNEINMTLYNASDVGFMAANVEGDANVEDVGTLRLVFRNCNQGQAYYDTGPEAIGSGEFRIKRLTSIYNSRCSGGISDDTPSDAKPLKLEVLLMPARDDISGSGKAKFWERTDRSDFQVEIEDVPDGTYKLEVCAEGRGNLVVLNGEGEIEFRTPGNDNKPLLNFDPRNCLIELRDIEGAVEGEIALTSGDAILSEKTNGKKDDDDDDDDGDKIVIKTDLVSSGEIEGAEGELEFEIDGDEREFEVEIESIPVGTYSLVVADTAVGDIEVVEEDGATRGKLKFSNPQTADTLLLEFNPRGKVVEVFQGSALILDALFPDE
jgi:hypothetical protein